MNAGMNARIFPITACVASLALSSCRSTPDAVDRSREYYTAANYYQSFQELADERESNPGDPMIEREYQRARIAFLLERAQEDVFREREPLAIRNLQQALTLDPDNEVAKRWLDKALHKLAKRTAAAGDQQRERGNLEEALKLYSEALRYVPDHAGATEGVALVRVDWASRRSKANTRYLQGVRALAEQLFGQTWYQMGIALEKDPGLANARTSQQTAQRRLIEHRYEMAKQMERDGYYAASLKEYQACAKLMPDLEGIADGIARMERETKAEDLARQGEHKMMRNEFEEARKLLEQAWEISVVERAAMSEMLVALNERAMQDLYGKALDLEYQHQKEKALALFKKVDEGMPEGFKDVKARISSLESDLAVAGRALMRGLEAEKAGDQAAALDAYQEALLVYPGYEQLDAKVAELKKALLEKTREAPKSESDGNAGATEGNKGK